MTKRETTSLLIKLAGVYCLVQVAPSLIHILQFLTMIRDSQHTWLKLTNLGMMIVFPAIWIVFCILIIRMSDSIAKRLYREDSDASKLSSLGFREVQVLGYNFIGLSLLVQSLPQILSLVTSIKTQQIYIPQYWTKEDFYMHSLPWLLSILTQFFLGLILFLKPNGLANLWQKAQAMKYERAKLDNKVLEDIVANAPNPQD